MNILCDVSKTDLVFKKEHLDALCGVAPMTPKIFEEILDIYAAKEGLAAYQALLYSFPEQAILLRTSDDSEEE